MCPIFHRKHMVTGNIFPPGSLISKLVKGDLIKEIGRYVSGLFYGFVMGMGGVGQNYRLK